MRHSIEDAGSQSVWTSRRWSRLAERLVPIALFLMFLTLYVRTAAPSVLSGDSAEFQLAAPLLGVPHPTTYPLYVLLGKLATLVVPFGDLAWRVTLVSALGGALAVMACFVIARRVLAATAPAAIGALALGLTPGLWNAATMAEVYAVLAALLGFLAGLLITARQQPSEDGNGDAGSRTGSANSRPVAWRRLQLAALVGGLGVTHHGLFVITGLPLLAGYLLRSIVRWPAAGSPARQRAPVDRYVSAPMPASAAARQALILTLCFAAGLLPWLFPLIQYARYGPFAGIDYGLPRHYFWGAPAAWGQALDLIAGGGLRQGIFRVPAPAAAAAVLRMVGERLVFEFGPVGVPLGLAGGVVLFRRARLMWIGAAWVFGATLAYLLALGPAVQDAPVFTLPMLLPWALWIAQGSHWLIDRAARIRPARSPRTGRRSWALVALLLAATLLWGDTRLPSASKRRLWLFRQFGEATLERLPPNAAVMTHWEQGMVLQYLIRAEGYRPDVWVDVVEPGDEDWAARARRRYADRPVFFIGAPADVAGLPAELVHADAYASLYVWRAPR